MAANIIRVVGDGGSAIENSAKRCYIAAICWTSYATPMCLIVGGSLFW
jgi:hypothetical protein